jgi:hypothetical protein
MNDLGHPRFLTTLAMLAVAAGTTMALLALALAPG